jgi:hypothetical protein
LTADEDDEVLLVEPPHAAATVESATAAPITAADLVTFTARFSFQALSLGWPCGWLVGRYEVCAETNRKLSYKIEPVARLR